MKKIYLDYASTTPMDPIVLDRMRQSFLEDFGNPSSPHAYGQSARKSVEDARESVARLLNAKPEEILFTSGGSESNNHAILGVARALREKGNHIIVSQIEHHSVLRPAQELVSMGFDVTFLDVGQDGMVDPEVLRRSITPQTILISVMHASNEIGTIQPISAIGIMAKEKGVCFHVDAVQTAGHLKLDVQHLGCDLLSLTAHKFYGPKGVGALFVRKGVKILPFLLGGDQEQSRRASTLNVPGIIGLQQALWISRNQLDKEVSHQILLRNRIIETVLKDISGSRLNGHPTERLPNNTHFSFDGVNGEALILSLDMNGFCASMGSACTAGSLTPSHVLKAIGLSDEHALGSLRITTGRWTTIEEIEAFCSQLKRSIKQLRK